MSIRKIISLLSMLLVIFGSTICFAETSTSVSVGTATGKQGEIITIPVDLLNCQGFTSLGIEIGYNSNVMKLVSATNSQGVGGNFTPAPDIAVNPYTMKWNNSSNISFNGTIATLSFQIEENAQNGIYPIIVSFYKGPNEDFIDGDDVNFDDEFKPLNLQYVSGAITVRNIPNSDMEDSENTDISFSFNENISDPQNGGHLIAALYDASGKLLETKFYPIADEIPISFTKASAGAYVKVMRWEISSIRPMTNAKIIRIQ